MYNSSYSLGSRYGYNPTYQPMYAQYPQMPMQQYMQQPIQQPIEPPIQAVKFVNENEAKAYIVLPNTKEMLIDKDNGIAYLKSADQMGQSSTKIFRFEEVIEKDKNEAGTGKIQPERDMSDFVKREDLSNFIKTDAIESLSRDIYDRLNILEKKIKINDIVNGLGGKDGE